MSVSRRTFLAGVAGAVVAPFVPAVPAEATAPMIDIEAVAAPLQKMWAVGTPGEYDWQGIAADTMEEAFKFYREEHGFDEEDEDVAPYGDLSECVQRVPLWDGKSPRELTGEDWFKASFGYLCSECSYEASPETGARAIEGQVYCEDCLTLRLKIIDDPDDVVDTLANDIACDGEEGVRATLIARKEWDDVPAELWARACEEARRP